MSTANSTVVAALGGVPVFEEWVSEPIIISELAILARLHGPSAQWSGSTQDASVAETVLAQAEEMLAMRQ
ncbi:MAG: hypothetical protein QM286_12480 [Acidobacteriota bacterium]|nr:hypothetical protein [Acidobacteriota bacterium]